MICVDIDEFTPCLYSTKTGELVDTEVIRIKRSSFLSKYNKKNHWYANWAELLQENEVYALVVKGTVSIQGLIAVHKDESSRTAFIDWAVASPSSNKKFVETKEYNGIGGHLFAIAVNKSIEYGFGGAVSGFAANADLMHYYIDAFNAQPICMLHDYQIFIDEADAVKILEVYTYEWTDEEL